MRIFSIADQNLGKFEDSGTLQSGLKVPCGLQLGIGGFASSKNLLAAQSMPHTSTGVIGYQYTSDA